MEYTFEISPILVKKSLHNTVGQGVIEKRVDPIGLKYCFRVDPKDNITN